MNKVDNDRYWRGFRRGDWCHSSRCAISSSAMFHLMRATRHFLSDPRDAPECGKILKGTALMAWLKRVEARPSMQATLVA
jgi:hypothetical protein